MTELSTDAVKSCLDLLTDLLEINEGKFWIDEFNEEVRKAPAQLQALRDEIGQFLNQDIAKNERIIHLEDDNARLQANNARLQVRVEEMKTKLELVVGLAKLETYNETYKRRTREYEATVARLEAEGLTNVRSGAEHCDRCASGAHNENWHDRYGY